MAGLRASVLGNCINSNRLLRSRGVRGVREATRSYSFTREDLIVLQEDLIVLQEEDLILLKEEDLIVLQEEDLILLQEEDLLLLHEEDLIPLQENASRA